MTKKIFLFLFALSINLLNADPAVKLFSADINADSLVDNALFNSQLLEQVLEKINVEQEQEPELMDTDSILLDLFAEPKVEENKRDSIPPQELKIKHDTVKVVRKSNDTLIIPFPIKINTEKIRQELILEYIPEYFLRANPLLTDLVFKGYPLKFDWNLDRSFGEMYFEQEKKTIFESFGKTFLVEKPESYILHLRDSTFKFLNNRAPELYRFRAENLKSFGDIVDHRIENKPISAVVFTDEKGVDLNSGIKINKLKRSPWTKKANALLQFSQNYISPNWYQGGSDNVAILGIVNGQLNFDNKKSIQWDNNFEWRTGFNSVDGDTLRMFNTNDDILKVYSKLGIKAGGNWFYTGSFDFSTHFFNSYKAINSMDLRATMLTPVRLNIGVGLDYKYKKVFSAMLSPLAFKYIYANDTVHINPGNFGISKGENQLKQFGSSFKAQTSFSPLTNVNIDSKLNFYTNYEKIEVDWEIVGTFVVNRFLSTRLSLNPRYDNTVFLAAGERATIQFKELLTFGLSYKILD